VKKKYYIAISLLILLSLLFACQTAQTQQASTPTQQTTPAETKFNYIDIPLVLNAKEDAFKDQIGDFAKSQLPTFKIFTLDNGIPVIVKINPANRIYNLQLVLRGGASLAKTDDAGIEMLMLNTMERGSKNYDYETIQKILDETSSAISSSVSFDFSTYSLNTIDKYFDKTLPIWLDTLSNPSFTQSDFDKALANMKMYDEETKSDPYYLGIQKLNQAFFKNTPYASTPEGTTYSLKKMTLEKVKKYYENYFSSNRMFIVAVGNYNVDTLKTQLNSTLGTVKNNDVKFVEPFSFYGKVKNDLLKVPFSQSRGVCYLRGDFAAPAMSSEEYLPFSIAMNMFSDLLFSIVREKYSACYTPMAYGRTFLASYASIVIYKTTKTAELKKYIDEAVTPLLKGMCLNQDPSLKETFVPIENALEVYKQLYINSTYEKQQTNAAMANQIILSIFHFQDYRYYLLDIDRVQKVTAQQIKDAIQKYLTQPIMWMISGEPNLVNAVNPNDYLFLGIK